MPHRLEILYHRWEDEAHVVEKVLHRLLQPSRMNGEWFDIERARLETLMRETAERLHAQLLEQHQARLEEELQRPDPGIFSENGLKIMAVL
jgi:hypothetical protein